MDLLERLRRSLGATRALLGERLGNAPGGLEPNVVEEALLAADVGLEVAEAVAGDLAKARKRGEITPGSEIRWLERRLGQAFEASTVRISRGKPHVVLVVGVNGTGKTTTVAKLASASQREGHRVSMVAADTFRAAAAEQLQRWGERLGIPVFTQRAGADPGAVVFDALQAARSRDTDEVFVDTAGRLHTKHNLMAELEKVRRVCARAVPGAPHEVLLVLDATTGANGVVQAKEFRAHAGVTGVVLAKLDGTAKGGVALAVAQELGVPIRWIGVGEKHDDLLPFDSGSFAAALLEGLR